MLVIKSTVWAAILADLLEHAVAGPHTGPFDALKIALYTDTITPDGNTAFADLTEPAYTGYAQQAFTWGPIWQRPDGGYVVTGVNKIFQMGNAALQTTVRGYAIITSGGSPEIVGIENFPAPITLTTILDAAQVMPQIVLGGADNGTAIVQGP